MQLNVFNSESFHWDFAQVRFLCTRRKTQFDVKQLRDPYVQNTNYIYTNFPSWQTKLQLILIYCCFKWISSPQKLGRATCRLTWGGGDPYVQNTNLYNFPRRQTKLQLMVIYCFNRIKWISLRQKLGRAAYIREYRPWRLIYENVPSLQTKLQIFLLYCHERVSSPDHTRSSTEGSQ